GRGRTVPVSREACRACTHATREGTAISHRDTETRRRRDRSFSVPLCLCV
ncbi:MAG: hypothetical protein AVDCRST_MAG68-221, partial [uncultured Gemmatimonadetes bacterium]